MARTRNGRRQPSLRRLYARLQRSLGPQHWWPAQTPFEVMVGAILTQATNWRNVERAVARLKAARVLSAKALATMRVATLQRLIRSAGYFKQKATRLRVFSRWYLISYGANVTRMFRTDPWTLRRQLLEIPGIGPETADSILLYAGNRPVFVVDGYTRRIFRRHQLIARDASYDAIQHLVMDRLPRSNVLVRGLPEDPQLFNEFHALLVEVGKRYCHRRDPDCPRCPLGDWPRQLEVSDHG